MSELTLKYSTSALLKHAQTKEDANKITQFYKVQQPATWDEDTIQKLVTTQSLSPIIFLNENRVLGKNNSNYGGHQHIMLDFDKGLQFDTALSIMKLHLPNTAFCMFTTNSHTAHLHKFRVLIPLYQTLNGVAVDKLLSYFVDKFNDQLDKTCFDKHRYFYKGNNTIWYFQDGQYFDVNSLQSYKISKTSKTYITPNQKVLTEYQTEVTINDIQDKTIVHCPFHTDNTPSAVVFVNPGGVRQLFCSSCKAEGRGTDSNGNYYYETQRNNTRVESKIKVFYCQDYHSVVQILSNEDLLENSYRKICAGDEWKIWCNNHNYDANRKLDLVYANIAYIPREKSDFVYRPEVTFHNSYIPSKYIKDYPNKIGTVEDTLHIFKEKAPITYKVIENIAGTENVVFYLNWYAHLITNTPSSIGTCLVHLNTLGGIGKNVMFERIWTPIVGEKNAYKTDGEKIGRKFNKQLANRQLVLFDEIYSKEDTNLNNRRINWLKSVVGSNSIEIEPKGVDPITVRNFAGIVIHTQVMESLVTEKGERRRFVYLYNPKAVELTKLDFETFKFTTRPDFNARIDAEIPFIAEYIQSVIPDSNLADDGNPETEIQIIISNAMSNRTKEFVDFMKTTPTQEILETLDPQTALRQSYFKFEPDVLGVDKTQTLKYAVERIETFISKHRAIPKKYLNSILSYYGIKNPNQEINKLMLYGATTDRIMLDGSRDYVIKF